MKSKEKRISFILVLALICIIPIVTVGLTRFFYPCIQNWFSIEDGYNAATLTSALLMAIVTILYVIFTYFIFDATNKNTQQTANAQKVAYLERRLELFYLPMENALRKVDIKKIQKLNEEVESNNSHHALYYLIQMWWSFREDYDKVVPFVYLASDDVKISVNKFTNIFTSNRLFAEKFTEKFMPLGRGENYPDSKISEYIKEGLNEEYLKAVKPISDYHSAALAEIEKDIKSRNKELAKLVNP